MICFTSSTLCIRSHPWDDQHDASSVNMKMMYGTGRCLCLMCLPSIIPECSAVDNEKLRYGDNGTRNETDTRGAGHWNEFRREAWTTLM